MAEKPTQQTPKGYEIPVPTHVEVDRVLERAAQPVPAKPKRSRRKRRPAK
jgi:hypothetical protein